MDEGIILAADVLQQIEVPEVEMVRRLLMECHLRMGGVRARHRRMETVEAVSL